MKKKIRRREVTEKKNEIEVIPSQVLTTKDAIQRRSALEAYVKECLIQDTDFSVDERTEKKNLLQAGADKVLNLYGLTSRVEVVKQVEDWDKGFFHYEVKTTIIWPRKMEDGSIREEIIAEGMGSCNSKESKYAYRWMSRAEMPKETQALADKGMFKTETREKNVPWFTLTDEEKERCEKEGWKKADAESKGGKVYVRVDHPGVVMYRVPNEDICDQVNTILKMAKKRSYVDATIRATKAGDLFTQDLEDIPNTEGRKTVKEKEKAKAKETPKDSAKETAKEATGEAELTAEKKAEIVKVFEANVVNCKDLDGLNELYKSVPKGAKEAVYAMYSVRYKELTKKDKQE